MPVSSFLAFVSEKILYFENFTATFTSFTVLLVNCSVKMLSFSVDCEPLLPFTTVWHSVQVACNDLYYVTRVRFLHFTQQKKNLGAVQPKHKAFKSIVILT